MRCLQSSLRLMERRTLLSVAGSLMLFGTHRDTPGISYTLTITTTVSDQGIGGRDVVVGGHGVATARDQRLDIDSIAPNGTLLLPHDYFLMLDTGKTTQVGMENDIYTNEFNLSGAAGVHAALPIGALDVTGLPINDFRARLEPLSDKIVVSGYTARHFRVTIDYTVTSEQEEVPFRSVVDVWMAQLPFKLSNPFEEVPLLDSVGPIRGVFGKLASIRRQMGAGAPLKTVTTTTIYYAATGGRRGANATSLDVVQTSQFSNIKSANVSPDQFTIPRGFQKSG